MKCQVCGDESGKYPLCKQCNIKKEQGLIAKCVICNKWHYKDAPCPTPNSSSAPTNSNAPSNSETDEFLYEPKRSLITKTEFEFLEAIKQSIPAGYQIFPQINLAAFINKTGSFRFQNELFRNIDFLITDNKYTPKIVIEINDRTHLTADRAKRDEKVKNILEEAGIPLLKLWTSYGINNTYVKTKIDEYLNNPVLRIHHFDCRAESENNTEVYAVSQNDSYSEYTYQMPYQKRRRRRRGGGCYIATCVYGSYDCPQVWTLRRFRDFKLSSNVLGRLFIKLYYAISPTIVKWFGKSAIFQRFCKAKLDKLVCELNDKGYSDTPYLD